MTKNKNKYIPFYYDALFYKIFGDEKDTSLLKRLIELSLNIKIKELSILNGKMLSDKYKGKVSYLDLYVKLEDGKVVNIEVNTSTDYYIKDRNLYFLAKGMGNDMDLGDSYYEFKKHYQINLNASRNRQKLPVLTYYVMNEETGLIFSDKLQILDIDLVSFKKLCYTNSTTKKLNEFEKLMGLLGCENKEDQKFFEHEKGMIATIMEKAEKFRDDGEMIEMYDRDVMLEHLRRKQLSDAILKTTEEVTKEVTLKNFKDIARNMLNKKMSIKDISDVTGLTLEEVNKLKKEEK